MKAGVPTLSHKLRPSQCRARLVAVHVPSLHKSSIAKHCKTSSNAVDFATKVWFSLFGGSEVTDIGYEGEIVQHVVTQKLANCIA